MTSRELVARTIRFERPERIAFTFLEKYGSDFAMTDMEPSPNYSLSRGVDEWGSVWDNKGGSEIGEVVDHPIKDWKDLDTLKIPDIYDPRRWVTLQSARKKAGDKFLLGCTMSLFQRLCHLRGTENVLMDIYEYPQQLERLLDILVDMSLVANKRYAQAGVDCIAFADDWGMQDRLAIHPDVWRKIWKPRYARLFKAAHDKGMFTYLHSCGYIVEIMDDLIEIGLDIINTQQQTNMGLERLGQRFGGRITFCCGPDIQTIMTKNNLDEIRDYCRKLVRVLGRPEGGFIAECYRDPVGAGHSPEAVEAECTEFFKINAEMMAGNWTDLAANAQCKGSHR